VRRCDLLLLTVTLIVCLLSVHACRRGEWPFAKVAAVSVMPWPEARAFLARCKPTPAAFRKIQAAMKEATRCT
jgi:hypothetical protein